MLALWLGIAWPALAGGPFVINGKLAGVEDGAVVRLFRPDGSMGAAVAADTLRNGRFMPVSYTHLRAGSGCNSDISRCM